MSLDAEILALEEKFWQAMVDGDVAAAAGLAADPCIVTGARGVARIDRVTFAQMMEGGEWKLHAFAFSDVKVERVTDEVAVIGYRVREDATVAGRRMTFEAADASTWVRRDGRWLCVLHTESVIGDPFGQSRPAAGAAVG